MSKITDKNKPLIGAICNAQREMDSFRPISVDQILQDIRTGVYSAQVEGIREGLIDKNKDEVRFYSIRLPIIYPSVECPASDDEEPAMLNGLAVVRMSYFDIRAAHEALRHIKVWPFVKACYTNAFGQTILYIFLGRDYKDVSQLNHRRSYAIEMMNTAMPDVHFDYHNNWCRGAMAAYDPDCFCRPDSELNAFDF